MICATESWGLRGKSTGGTEETVAVEGGVVGVHSLTAGIAGFADKVWIHGVGDPANTKIALSLRQLLGDFVRVIIKYVGNGAFGGKKPVVAGARKVFTGEVTDKNMDGGRNAHSLKPSP